MNQLSNKSAIYFVVFFSGSLTLFFVLRFCDNLLILLWYLFLVAGLGGGLGVP